MVPLGSVATFRDITGPYRVARYNLYPAAEFRAAPCPATRPAMALAAMEGLGASSCCPRASASNGPSSPTGEACRQHRDPCLLASVVFVFLLLAAQYESWSLPLAVILIVPMCLLAAVSGLLARAWTSTSWRRSASWC